MNRFIDEIFDSATRADFFISSVKVDKNVRETKEYKEMVETSQQFENPWTLDDEHFNRAVNLLDKVKSFIDEHHDCILADELCSAGCYYKDI